MITFMIQTSRLVRTAIEREKHLIEKKNKGPKFELGAKDLEEHRFGALSNAGSSP